MRNFVEMNVPVSATVVEIVNFLADRFGTANIVTAKTRVLRDVVTGGLMAGSLEGAEAPALSDECREIVTAVVEKAFKPWLDKPEKTEKKAKAIVIKS